MKMCDCAANWKTYVKVAATKATSNGFNKIAHSPLCREMFSDHDYKNLDDGSGLSVQEKKLLTRKQERCDHLCYLTRLSELLPSQAGQLPSASKIALDRQSPKEGRALLPKLSWKTAT